MTDSSVAVLIPALDEEGAVGSVVEGFRAQGARVVVVDNGSRDGTSARARGAGAEVVSERHRGYGGACLAGIAYLSRVGPPEVLVFADGDGSVDGGDLGRILEPIRGGRADLVLGFRSNPHNVPEHQQLGNRIVLALVYRLFGIRFRDIPPFRAIKWDSLRAMNLRERSYGLPIETLLRAHQTGARVEEIPLGYRTRQAGRSKVSGRVKGTIWAGGRMMLVSFRLRLASGP